MGRRDLSRENDRDCIRSVGKEIQGQSQALNNKSSRAQPMLEAYRRHSGVVNFHCHSISFIGLIRQSIPR